MAGVLCVWANLPDSVLEWYEDEFIPLMTKKNSIYTLQCELTPTGFGEEIGQLEVPWSLCAVYESLDIRTTTDSCYDSANRPSEEQLNGPLKEAQVHVKTYRELNKWQQDWDGDVTHIVSVSCLEWQVTSDIQEEVVEWYNSFAGPLVSSSPEVLRLRFFEAVNVAALKGPSYEAQDKDKWHTFFCLAELISDQPPWDVLLKLGESEVWKKYFENQIGVQWKTSGYLVRKLYNKEHPNGLDLVGDSGSEEDEAER
ncbi:hypothetical protein GQ44DRAFT_615582 [Phaeosphaeriaceae sp. PMI808]|nr:hypothetical protein GQ44DRAFT_615582 [Phaeosphaeriaceae sp. PMI808]